MAREMIDRKRFIGRLTAMCVRGALRGLPRKRSDRAILLMSIVQRLQSDRAYTQAEINEAVREWRRVLAPALTTDHVSLRRWLVDEGFLERAADGTVYRRTRRSLGAIGFASDVAGLDAQGAVEAARREVATRRSRYTRHRGVRDRQG